MGAAMGMLDLALAGVSIALHRRDGTRGWSAMLAIALSLLAVALFPFSLWACSSWLECV